VLPFTPLVHPVKSKVDIPVYLICSLLMVIIPPVVGMPVTEATPIVVTLAFIPADNVVGIPSDAPSAGER